VDDRRGYGHKRQGEEDVTGDGKIKTPTLPKIREEWGTQNAWKREPKNRS
jgi:hypothetical protein